MKRVPEKNFILKEMRRGIVEVKFTKANGEERVMHGTLNSSRIPKREHRETNPNPHNESKDLVRCFDVEKDAWRSFKISTLLEYNGIGFQDD